MSDDDTVQRLLQCFKVQHALDAKTCGDVVGRTCRVIELVQKP